MRKKSSLNSSQVLLTQRTKVSCNTESTGLKTQRSIIQNGNSKIIQNEDSVIKKVMPFTIKRNIFKANEIKYNQRRQYKQQIKQVAQKQLKRRFFIKQPSQSHRHYHSLQSHHLANPSSSSHKIPPKPHYSNSYHSLPKDISSNSTSAQTILSPKIQYQIETKSSSNKNQFQNVRIRAYGIANFKGRQNIVNQLVVINLGLIKEFYVIQPVDGLKVAQIVKKTLSYLLLKQFLNQIHSKTDDISKDVSFKINCLQTAAFKAFHQLNNEIFQIQKQAGENSGCFITGILVIQNFILTIGCGMGASILYSTSGKIFPSNVPHSTNNKFQIQRLCEKGHKVSRLQFNQKYKTQPSIKGPLRLYPSGFTFTRILGKSFSKNEQTKCLYKDFYNPENHEHFSSGLVGTPEIKYIQTNDICYAVICCSKIYQFLKISLVCSIVNKMISKISLHETIHDISREAAKEILYQACLRGFHQSASLIVIFFNSTDFAYSEQIPLAKQQVIQKSSTQHNLQYAGNREKFCQYLIKEQI